MVADFEVWITGYWSTIAVRRDDKICGSVADLFRVLSWIADEIAWQKKQARALRANGEKHEKPILALLVSSEEFSASVPVSPFDAQYGKPPRCPTETHLQLDPWPRSNLSGPRYERYRGPDRQIESGVGPRQGHQYQRALVVHVE